MKIKDAAELTGTTVRTIRWYHREGLVPVPEVQGGRRDYDLPHIARILRVRWLAQAGLPLSSVRDLLDRESPGRSETGTVVAVQESTPTPVAGLSDLQAALAQVEASMEELHHQRDRILHLIESAKSGRGLSSVPLRIDRIYTRFEQAVPDDPHIQRVLRRERRMAEMLCHRGLIHRDLVEALDMEEAHIEQCVDFLVRFVALKEMEGEAVGPAVVELSEDMLVWCQDHPDLVRLYLAVIPGWQVPAVRSVVMRLLMLEYRDPHQRMLLNRTLEGLTQLIEQGVFEGNPRQRHPAGPVPISGATITGVTS
ncbi:MerR family transcriptional regulator [Kocuria sp.]|uniref:MerR family transcriptional regulator n=1 Tax=Kocuria sp. TaxID=1871328 RepID=UPI0026E03D79|nr:MerR family transcriptional regulator [Kocuria sp.]MDO5618154.1 MerR family transcriptional regulator [Kocuria sp.]